MNRNKNPLLVAAGRVTGRTPEDFLRLFCESLLAQRNARLKKKGGGK